MAETENIWRKRQTKSFNCPSGNVITVRRPGPDLTLKAGKVARVLKAQAEAGADIQKQLQFMETLPDAELEKLMDFARVLIVDVVIQPPLSLNPKEGQLGPDDVPLEDFWAIYIAAMRGFPDMPVRTTEGETTLENVSNFPEGQGSSSSVSEDSEVVQ